MELIKSTSRRIVTIPNWGGICDKCGTPVTFPSELIVVIVLEEPNYDILVPIDILECPECKTIMHIMRIFKNMEVTAEFGVINKNENT